MRDARGLDHPHLLEAERRDPVPLEEADAAAEEGRDEVELYRPMTIAPTSPEPCSWTAVLALTTPRRVAPPGRQLPHPQMQALAHRW